ncbi:MlaD family protein [Porphyromonas gingivalis]|uniref:MlaD family protein n=1 Tax=Porphyromonas gingivalis TaxID=837 RepID=UPI002480D919|nr:MlaD family protein [Porphyromonas gingivalis]MDH7904315.1 MlaD family protein [Porphyromonas gingivalis]
MRISKTTKIGALTLIALFLLYFGLNYLKGFNVFKRANVYYAAFPEVKNVNIASPVLVNGYKVGVVKSLNFDYKNGRSIVVGIDLESEYRMPKGSHLAIHQTALSGAELRIMQGDPRDGYLNPGDTIRSETPDDIMSVTSNKIVPSVANMMPKVDSVIVGLANMVNNPNLAVMMENMAATAQRLNRLTASLDKSIGTQLPAVMANTRTITDNVAMLSEELKQLKLEALMAELQATSENLRSFSDQIRNSNGSLGMLLNDKSLYMRLDSMASSADALLRDLKANPKRYVHFSVF